MSQEYRRCCGLDIHKETVVACVLPSDANRDEPPRRKVFATFTRDLIRLRCWLKQCKVTDVAMESTGVYWKLVWNVLEGHFDVLLLANPGQVKALQGRKTDHRDARRVGEFLQDRRLDPSFVPPRHVREWRDLTRYRAHLKQDRNRIHNRIHRALEESNIKLDCVASDILGTSGRHMIEGLIDGKFGPEFLADRARKRLREKIPQLKQALRGTLTDHHRLLLRQLLADLDALDAKVARLEAEIAARLQPHSDLIERLCTVPGIDVIVAWTILAEVGSDVNAFPDADHLVSWAALCPGNRQSGGKRISGHTRKGNRYLRSALCQAAWAASRTKDTYLSALFFRLAARHGVKKATVAVAHQLLRIAFHIIRDGGRYRELGGNYFDRLHPERTRKRLIRRLEALGYRVTLAPHDNPGPNTA